MDSTEIIDGIENQEWTQSVADGLAAGTRAVFESLGPAAQPIKNILHGTFLGHPLHPALTDVPVGAWTAAAVLDTAEAFGVEGVAQGADMCVAVGFAGAVVAAIAGIADWYTLDDQKPKKIGAVHATLNIAATAAYATSIALRAGKSRGLARFFAGIGYGLVGVSSYLGGVLVYDLKIGVDHADRENLPQEWTPVLAGGELEENVPECAKAGDAEVVLVKQQGRVKALANLCSHLGGPLCEGKVEAGTIVCPWHASRFDLNNGSVIDGPATAPQPAFDTRLVDGTVEVKSVR